MSDDSNLLHEMNGKLDQVIASFDRHFDDDNRNFAEIRSGLKAVEKKTYWLTGIVGALAFVAGKLTGKF